MGKRYRYPWKPPYAPGWLLGWPGVETLSLRDFEDKYGYFDLRQGDGYTAVSGDDDYNNEDNTIHLYMFNEYT